ncbi:transposase [Streptomyces sp. Ru72]|uniref:IS110 family transposase n=1 Tax=Streptomyces sp. Ru72 TaxID=2080747 RepID=UPI0035BE3AC2
MVIFGVDTHKRNHTAVVIDERGRELGSHTTGTTSADRLRLLAWAHRFGGHRTWAVKTAAGSPGASRQTSSQQASGSCAFRPGPWFIAAPPPAARTASPTPSNDPWGGRFTLCCNPDRLEAVPKKDALRAGTWSAREPGGRTVATAARTRRRTRIWIPAGSGRAGAAPRGSGAAGSPGRISLRGT